MLQRPDAWVRWVVLTLFGLLALNAAGAPLDIAVDGKDGPRSAMLLLPIGADSTTPLPLVVLLHGRGASAAGSLGLRHLVPAPLSAWVDIATREHIAVLALQGSKGSSELAGWDDCRQDDSAKPVADDVAYTNAVLAKVTALHPIDLKRIYLMGMSNGAMMAFRLAAELDRPVAAMAAVAGPMPAGSGCPAPARPVSVLLIHGSADPLVPYGGGAVHFGTAEMGSVLSVDDTAAIWRRLDGIHDDGKSDILPRLPASEGKTFATRTLWGQDEAGLQVEVIRIDGGGHAEPSMDQEYGRIYLGLAGAQNHDFESAEEAWRFFRSKRSSG